VADHDDVVSAHFWCDRHVAGEVKVHWKRNELIQGHEVMRCHERDVEDQHVSFLIRLVDVRSFFQKEIEGWWMNERRWLF